MQCRVHQRNHSWGGLQSLSHEEAEHADGSPKESPQISPSSPQVKWLEADDELLGMMMNMREQSAQKTAEPHIRHTIMMLSGIALGYRPCSPLCIPVASPSPPRLRVPHCLCFGPQNSCLQHALGAVEAASDEHEHPPADFFYPDAGGVENHMFMLSHCLMHLGHKVLLSFVRLS